jgi:hypothetical protein
MGMMLIVAVVESIGHKASADSSDSKTPSCPEKHSALSTVVLFLVAMATMVAVW